MGWWTPERQRYAMQYLTARGLSVYGAAGLVSRWANVESTGAGPTAVNPSSGAFGIAQWLGSRKRGIYPNTNFDAQLAFVIAELQRPESRDTGIGYGLLRSATDADTAAVGATMYERAEGYAQKRPRDNFTARTAAGIPATLAYYQGGGGVVPMTTFTPQTGAVVAGLGGVGVLLLIGGAVLLYVALSD